MEKGNTITITKIWIKTIYSLHQSYKWWNSRTKHDKNQTTTLIIINIETKAILIINKSIIQNVSNVFNVEPLPGDPQHDDLQCPLPRGQRGPAEALQEPQDGGGADRLARGVKV